MSSNVSRAMTLGGAALSIFLVLVILLLQAVPGPHTEVDYLLIGSISTLSSMAVVFLVVIKTWIRDPEPFFKKRKKQ